jgi:4-amino-4-deoxy-L-arabinose transferase-like glycosyltransferase
MKYKTRSFAIFLIFLTVTTIAYLSGIKDVPFHPDESTYIYTSSDLEMFVQQPSALYWRAGQDEDKLLSYRMLDGPLNRILIGLGRAIMGKPALQNDWDWGQTWEENQQAGAMPSADLLQTARVSIAVLFPLSLLLLFLAVQRTANTFTAWVAVILLASNALVLLHTRRAMAESGLLFATILLMYSLTRVERRLWLTAIPAAFAICAKYSLAALAPVGLVPMLVQYIRAADRSFFRLVRQGIIYGVLLLGILFLMHPYLWAQPVQALQAAVQKRQALSFAQSSDRPEQRLDSPGYRLIGMIGSLYLTPPIFQEVGNYIENTAEVEKVYLANPLHSLFRSIPAGGILLFINLFGFIIACRKVVTGEQTEKQRRLIFLLAATVVQTLALLVMIPLAWQRYYMPLVPFACLWTAYGIDQLRQAVRFPASKKPDPALYTARR